MCGCGSKVLFDALGPPWPKHDCERSGIASVRRWVGDDGRERIEVAAGVTWVRPETDFQVEPAAIRRADPSQRGERPDPIVAMRATRTADETVIGVVRELREKADPFEAFDIVRTTVGRSLLRQIGRQPVGKITVHAPSPYSEDLESYTAWIPTALMEGLERGDTVSVDLEGVHLPGDLACEWFCRSVERLGGAPIPP